MANFNKVILIGNLTRDPELRYMPNNTPVANVGLAVNDRWKDRDSGQWQSRANFIDCEAFAVNAENINKFFRKGRPILVEGKLRMDQWEDQQGNKRSKLKVVIDRWEFVDSRADGEGEGGGGSGSDRAPARQSISPPAPMEPHPAVEEGDIPF